MSQYLKFIIPSILVILIALAYLVYNLMTGPIYKPGNLKSSKFLVSPLAPPTQADTISQWVVEEDIYLNHFASGNGRNVLIIHGGPGMPYSEAWSGLKPLEEKYKFHYYDQRGSGESSRPIDTFSSDNYYENMKHTESRLGLTAQIADIERIRQILGEDKLIVIGHSYGGF